jgi:anaerobic selenocysteine-containing dehydrogenase
MTAAGRQEREGTSATTVVHPHMCRACTAYCPVHVTVDGNTVVKVTGNHDAPLYNGFICPKGRALPQMHGNPTRLTHCLKRQPDGSYVPIPSDQAIDEIAVKLRAIIDRHGPRSVAGFLGNPGVEQIATAPMMIGLLQAIGSRMLFTMATMDQPGLLIANAIHGGWEGGRMRPEALDTFLLVGGNPVISKQYFSQNPGRRLKELTRDGMRLIVIDPRVTETARRAAVHIQPMPGEDPTILAGLIHLILRDGRVNAEFVAANASGLDGLRAAVAPFTPAYVAARADIGEDVLHAAAAILGEADTGDSGSGTGASMATRGTLTAYLLLCIQTLRGFWAKEGQVYNQSSVLTMPHNVRAQPTPPTAGWGMGERMRVRGLVQSVAGLPAAALPEEILTPGEGQIRALFLHVGAALSMPDQKLTQRALEDLDLLISHDIEETATARLAHYVFASTLSFEIPAMTASGEFNGKLHHGYGWNQPYAAFFPALVSPPAGSDVLDPWRVYYRLGARMGYQIHYGRARKVALDMTREPDTEELYGHICAGSAVPLDVVKRYPNGHVFEEARVAVQPRDPDCADRLRLDDPHMLGELADIAVEDYAARRGRDGAFPYLFIPRRVQNVTNSMFRPSPALPGTAINPAFLHPDDLADLGLADGDLAIVRSRHGEIEAVVEGDATLRRGVLAMTHGYGRNLGEAANPRVHGANVNRLTSLTEELEPYSGMPRLGAIPIAVEPVRAA